MNNSSIVVDGSKDSDWKKEVDSPKLLLKIWRTASMLYFICWMACPNLLVKSRIDSLSCLRIVCKELMFLFCRTEQRYYDTNAAHSSLNEFIELRGILWNQANAAPHKLDRNTLHNRQSLSAFSIIAIRSMCVRVSRAIKRGKSWYDLPVRWLVVKNVLPWGQREHVVESPN